MKRVCGLLGVVVLAGLAWVGWEFSPWMPAGRAAFVSSTHVGDYDFQVWQRKNSGVTEPFTTWLFARGPGHKWMPYTLDFEDTYKPSILLRKEASGIAVLRGNKKLGVFDDTRQIFTRYPDGMSFPGAEIDSEPPGNW